jgi:hypothetical protein
VVSACIRVLCIRACKCVSMCSAYIHIQSFCLYALHACLLNGLCSPPHAPAGTSAWLVGLGSYSGGIEGGSQFLWTKHVDGTCAELSDGREIQLLPQYSGCKYVYSARKRL